MFKVYAKNSWYEVVELEFKTGRKAFCALSRKGSTVLDDAGKLHRDIEPSFGFARSRMTMEGRGRLYVRRTEETKKKWLV